MGDERVRMDGGEGSMGKGTRMLVWALVFGLLVLFLGAVADVVCVLMDWEEEIIVPIVRAIASFGFICLLGGQKMYQLDKDKVHDAWKFALPVVLINIAIVVLLLVGQIIGAIAGKISLNPEAPLRILYVTVLCLFVGIGEEGLFRGLVFGGLLAKLGSRKNGALIAAIISSVAFGLIHVIFDLDPSNPAVIVTGLLKALESAMFGLVLCVPVIETGNLWGAITVHAFFDWVLLATAALFTSGGPATASSYVSADPAAAIVSTILFFGMAVAYFIPTKNAVLRLAKMEPPQPGPLVDRAGHAPLDDVIAGKSFTKQAQEQRTERRKRTIFSNRYLTPIVTFLLMFVFTNLTSIIPYLVTKEGTLMRDLLSAIFSVGTNVLLLLWFYYTFKDSFAGVHDWSSEGMLLVAPALLFVLSNLIQLVQVPSLNNPFVAFLIAVQPGVNEEIALRAIPVSNWMRLDTRRESVLRCAAYTGLIFGLIHAVNLISGADPAQTLFQVFYAFCLGVFFAAVLLRCGSIIPAVIMHTLIDFTGMLAMDLSHGGAITETLTIDFGFWFTLVVSLVLVVASIYMLRPQKQADIAALWEKKWHKG